MSDRQHEESSSDDREKVAKTLGSLPSKQAQDFVRIYAPLVTVASNVFDMSLIFGQPISDNPDDPYIEQKASITMSWQAAKTLAGLLVATIRDYEGQIGEIKLPSRSQQSNDTPSE